MVIMSELRFDVRFVDDTQAIAFLELEIIFLSLVEVVQRSHYEVRCQTERHTFGHTHCFHRLQSCHRRCANVRRHAAS